MGEQHWYPSPGFVPLLNKAHTCQTWRQPRPERFSLLSSDLWIPIYTMRDSWGWTYKLDPFTDLSFHHLHIMDFAGITPFFVFVAFLLLLLVSISAPIIKSLYLFQLAADLPGRNNPPVVVNFGVWGYCIPSIRVACVICDNHRVISQPSYIFDRLTAGVTRTIDEYCSPIRLGYTFDGTVAINLLCRHDGIISPNTNFFPEAQSGISETRYPKQPLPLSSCIPLVCI